MIDIILKIFNPIRFQYGVIFNLIFWVIAYLYCIISSRAHPYTVYLFDKIIIILCIVFFTLMIICIILWAISITFLTYDYLPPLPKDIPAEWSYAFFKIKEKQKQRIRHYRRKINRRRLL